MSLSDQLINVIELDGTTKQIILYTEISDVTEVYKDFLYNDQTLYASTTTDPNDEYATGLKCLDENGVVRYLCVETPPLNPFNIKFSISDLRLDQLGMGSSTSSFDVILESVTNDVIYDIEISDYDRSDKIILYNIRKPSSEPTVGSYVYYTTINGLQYGDTRMFSLNTTSMSIPIPISDLKEGDYLQIVHSI